MYIWLIRVKFSFKRFSINCFLATISFWHWYWSISRGLLISNASIFEILLGFTSGLISFEGNSNGTAQVLAKKGKAKLPYDGEWPTGNCAAFLCAALLACDQQGRFIRRTPYLRLHHKSQRLKYTKHHLDKPEAFWKQVHGKYD